MTESALRSDAAGALPVLPRQLTDLPDEVAQVPPPPIPVLADP